MVFAIKSQDTCTVVSTSYTKGTFKKTNSHLFVKGKHIDGLTITTEQKILVQYDCSKILELIFDKDKITTTKLKHSFNFA